MASRRQWLGWLVLFVVIRLVLNAANRMAYPFLREFQAGLGLTLTATTQALAWRSASLVVGPALTWFAEHHGRRAGMLFGLGLFVAGMVLGGSWASWWGFTLALVLAAWAKVAFDASMQAFVGDRVAYARRGAVLAVTEYSWSLSFFVGMPVIGWLLARGGWRAPFWAMAGLGVLFVVGVLRVFDGSEGKRKKAMAVAVNKLNWLYALRSPWIAAAVAFGLFATAANEVVGLLFGVWLQDAYGFALTGLSLAAAVIGAAEFTGETFTVATVDGLGKERVIAWGLLGNGLAALALPWVAPWGPVAALAGLFAFFFTFEVLLVSSIPLLTEILPRHRALTMGAFAASVALGRALGAAIGPRLYTTWGMLAPAGAAVLFNGLAWLAVRRLGLRRAAGGQAPG